VIVWYLREKVMNDMGSNVMVDVIDPSIVTINGCKATPKVAPFLSNIVKNKAMKKDWI